MNRWPEIFSVIISGRYNEELLNKYEEHLNDVTCLYSSVLHYAILGGSLETIKYLLDKGVNVNARNIYCETPLHWCCKEGTLEMAELLINYGADVSCLDFDRNSPLHWAVEYNQHEIVYLLLFSGVSTTCKNSDKQTPKDIGILNSSKESLSILET